MRTISFIFLSCVFGFLSLFIFISCTKENEGLAPKQGNITLKIGIAGAESLPIVHKQATLSPLLSGEGATVALTPPVSASDFTSSFSAGDAIGVYLVPAGQPFTVSSAVLSNVKFTFDGAEWTSDVTWPGQHPTYDLYAYYPYRTTGGVADVDFSVQTDQSNWANFQQSDLMLAESSAVAKGSVVELTFSHLMSMLQVRIDPHTDHGQNPTKDMVVTLTGVKSKTSYSLGNLATAEATAQLANIKMYRVEQEGDANYDSSFTYRALLPRQELAAHPNRLLFTQTGDTFVRGQNAAFTLTSGSAYHLSVSPLEGLWSAVWIEPGIFQMGSPERWDGFFTFEPAQHWVRLTQGFYMGKYEVTTAEYASFLNAINVEEFDEWVFYLTLDGKKVAGGHTKFSFIEWRNGRWQAKSGRENRPMVRVTFLGALTYAQWAGGTLPTDAQWEYACRAGTTTPWSFGATDSNIDAYAWSVSSASDEAFDVGQLLPNPWGLYDMHGNVSEYCLYSGNYPLSGNSFETPLIDPIHNGPNNRMTVRGGGYIDSSATLRSARLIGPSTDSSNPSFGFRIIKYK